MLSFAIAFNVDSCICGSTRNKTLYQKPMDYRIVMYISYFKIVKGICGLVHGMA